MTVHFARLAFLLLVGATAATSAAATIPVTEDVMTSAFFTGTNLVRGYPGDARPTLRVSSDNAFGTGPETVYLTFNPAAFASYTAPVPQALLSVQSVAGGFNADATPDNAFQISAHAVNADPLTSILDDTNPGGTIPWLDFFTNNILPAGPAATTTVTGFGEIQFDVTDIVNDWISGDNTVFAIALTGKNDMLSNGDVLHGIRNNTEAPGSSYLTVVPEPSALMLSLLSLTAFAFARQRRLVKETRHA
jgi:hypothetical protein